MILRVRGFKNGNDETFYVIEQYRWYWPFWTRLYHQSYTMQYPFELRSEDEALRCAETILASIRYSKGKRQVVQISEPKLVEEPHES